VIDGLLGALSFDPLAFTRMKPAEQLETLKLFVPDVDFDAWDRANAADFSRRTELNRQVKDLKARAAGVLISETAPKEKVDEAELTERLEAAGRRNTEIEKTRLQRKAMAENVERLRLAADNSTAAADKLRNEINVLAGQAARWKADAEEIEARLKATENDDQIVDTAAIKAELSKARSINSAFTKNEHDKKYKETLTSQADESERAAAKLTQAIEARKQEKADAIAKAELPIPGIGFGDGVVLMNGIPFDQASDAEQLSASIAIAAAMNPKLRVIRVRDGSLLDTDAMQLLAEFADRHDLQIWIERVDSSGKVGFVLEAGELKAPAAEAQEVLS
jgi:hypothetical protein